MQFLIRKTPDLTGESVAAEIIAFHRQAGAGGALAQIVDVVATSSVLCSYFAAIALIVNAGLVLAGRESWLASQSEWRASELATFFGIFFVVHMVGAILWIVWTTKQDPLASMTLPKLAGIGVLGLLAILTGLCVFRENPSIWIVVSGVAFAAVVHLLSSGSMRTQASL